MKLFYSQLEKSRPPPQRSIILSQVTNLVTPFDANFQLPKAPYARQTSLLREGMPTISPWGKNILVGINKFSYISFEDGNYVFNELVVLDCRYIAYFRPNP